MHGVFAFGFRTQELVALTGAHTLGSKGFGDPDVFDNTYFKILLKKPWKSGKCSSSMYNNVNLKEKPLVCGAPLAFQLGAQYPPLLKSDRATS